MIKNNLDLVEWLFERGADYNSIDKRGDTPFIVACNNHNEKLARLLIETLQVNVEVRNRFSHQPTLHYVLKLETCLL